MKYLIILLLVCGLVHAEQPHKIHKKKLPPNCMIIGGQIRCWVIDPLPTEEEPWI